MRIGTPARIAVTLLAIGTAPLAAQNGSGDGFLFRPPPGSFTFYGGLAAPFANGGVHQLATSELTLDRGDFRTAAYGGALAFTVSPRFDVVVSVDRSRSQRRSEYRDWIDNNDQPIEQSTTFDRLPIMASVRYYLTDRGRSIGTVAWIPAKFVPFLSAGVGTTRFTFEQVGDFVDQETTNIFSDRLTSRGWATTVSAGGGAQWSLTPRLVLTGDARYLHAAGDGDAPFGEFAGYKVDLSGVSTMFGLTVRF